VRVLLLGGTSEASALARRLAGRPDLHVTTSLAGLTAERAPLPGEVRIGGFGGPEGLRAYLRADAVDVVVDATHPFARRMRWHAAEACAALGLPRLRLERPPWSPVPGDEWRHFTNLEAAADALGPGSRAFLTIGRRELAPFARRPDVWYLVRAIHAPNPLPLPQAEVVLARGPFAEADEVRLLREHRIDTLVAKNSGGDAAAAKLAAARTLGIRVVIVERPPSPAGPHAATVDGAVDWLSQAPPARSAAACRPAPRPPAG
jgi:precorrin-6A/cobalt-precorrin-6A reductase